MAAHPAEKIPDGRYKWTQFIFCNDIERESDYCTAPKAFGGVTQLHKEGDDVHFCLGAMVGNPPSCGKNSPGLLRYSMTIAETVKRYLKLS